MYMREAPDTICIGKEFVVKACVCVIEKKEPLKYLYKIFLAIKDIRGRTKR